MIEKRWLETFALVVAVVVVFVGAMVAVAWLGDVVGFVAAILLVAVLGGIGVARSWRGGDRAG